MGFNEPFDLRPNPWIAFNGGVAFEQQAIVPRIGVALRRLFFIVDAEISDDRGVRGIRRRNFGAAVKNTFALIKIDRLADIGRYNRIVLSVLADAINLDCQGNTDIVSL